MKTEKKIIYKFEFYGIHHHWLDEKDLIEQIEEALCYVEELNQLTELKAIECVLKPVRKGASK
tara:strand:+ start:161 stop:349 length:189 start_codon:yes stop_codon:yes gene_type:complete